MLIFARMSPEKKILVSVSNDLSTDQRIMKVCYSLQKAGYKPVLYGRKRSNSLALDQRSYPMHRLNLWFNKGPLFYFNLNLALFFRLLFAPCDLLLANDLDTLLANFLVSKIRRKPLIYDSHEFFTEVPELINRPRVQAIWLRLEAFLLPRIKFAYTVSRGIADAYKSRYGLEMKLVRNFPNRCMPEKSSPPGNYLLYQGALNVGRGLEELIEAMQYLPEMKLKIAGAGDLDDELRNLSKSFSVQDQITFLGRIEPKELLEITRSAQLGLSLEHDLGLSYRYALPNKIFDYLQARLPMIYPDLPEIKETLKNLEVGEVLKTHNPPELAKQIQAVVSSPEYSNWKKSCEKAAALFVWEEEEKVLLKLIQSAHA